jgi:radical SAM superfamily enzyme YgiQ (UPF0313 family)
MTPAKPAIRLTWPQRLVLMEIANAGGSTARIDRNEAVFLTHARLIEKRSRFTPNEKEARIAKRKGAFKQIATAARNADLKAIERLMRDLSSDEYHDNDTAYFLTPAAQEYLLHGTVTIKATIAKKKAPDAK